MNHLDFLDRLLALPSTFAARTSPDGRQVAFARRGFGHGAQVYIASLMQDGPVRRVTSPPGDCVPVSWSFDSGALVVARNHDGDERDALSLLDVPSGRETRLTERPDDHFLFGGALHPNGRFLFYAATKDFDSDRSIESAWLWRHDIRTGERLCIARPIGSHQPVPLVCPDGSSILYSRNDIDPAGRQLWLVDIDGSNDREILNAGSSVKLTGEWSPDGRSIAVHADGPGHPRVGLYDMTTARIRWLVDDPHRNVEAVHWPKGSDRIVCIETIDAVTRGFLLDPDSGKEWAVVDPEGATLLPIAPAASGTWLGERYDALHPRSLVMFDPADPTKPVPVAPGPDGIDPSELVAPESVTWRSSDDALVQGWLYRPKSTPVGAIVAVHGGPTWHIENRLSPFIQYLVHRGFVVLEPNYRGSTGFGPAWRDAIKVDGWGGREQDDIRAGIRMLIDKGIVPAGSVGVTGLSYGGYSAWCAATRWPVSEVAAAAPVCGMTDLRVDYETTRPDLRTYSIEMIGGTPDECPAKYYERSPINFVHNVRADLLIVQGMQDPNVTPENLAAVRAALDNAGVVYEVLTFDDEGHGIVKVGNRRILFHRVADFFERALARHREIV